MNELGPLQEINKEYYYFGAEADVARITLFVKQAFQALYQFIGESKYFAFMDDFKKIDDFSVKCDMNAMNEAMADYGMKGYSQDDPEILMRTLASYLK